MPDGTQEAPVDNCPDLENPEQEDFDGDGTGDACDQDVDGDQVPNPNDNCPRLANPSQSDANQDEVGNICDDEVRGTTIQGRISAEGPQLGAMTDTQVFLEGREAPAPVAEDGSFAFQEVLRESSAFTLTINREGYLPQRIREVADLSHPDFDCGVIELEPKTATLSGTIQIEGQRENAGIIISLTINNVVRSTQANLNGHFTIETFKWPQTLYASSENHVEQSWSIIWDEAQSTFLVQTSEGMISPLTGEGAGEITLLRRRDATLSKVYCGVDLTKFKMLQKSSRSVYAIEIYNMWNL